MRVRALWTVLTLAGVGVATLTGWWLFASFEPATALGSQDTTTNKERGSAATATRVVLVPAQVRSTITRVLVKPGDEVHAGMSLVQLDDRLAQNEIHMARLKVQMAEVEIKGGEAALAEAKVQFTRVQKMPAGFVPEEEVNFKKAVYEKFVSEGKLRQLALKLARLELDRAKMMREICQVTAPVHGRVVAIRKQATEAVGEMETVVEMAVEERKD